MYSEWFLILQSVHLKESVVCRLHTTQRQKILKNKCLISLMINHKWTSPVHIRRFKMTEKRCWKCFQNIFLNPKKKIVFVSHQRSVYASQRWTLTLDAALKGSKIFLQLLDSRVRPREFRGRWRAQKHPMINLWNEVTTADNMQETCKIDSDLAKLYNFTKNGTLLENVFFQNVFSTTPPLFLEHITLSIGLIILYQLQSWFLCGHLLLHVMTASN